jgi:toxin FitB
MNVVDSSGWLEFFADGPNADFFAPTIENIPELVVPSLSMYEVFKRVLQQRGEDEALQAAGVMAQGRVVPRHQSYHSRYNITLIHRLHSPLSLTGRSQAYQDRRF